MTKDQVAVAKWDIEIMPLRDDPEAMHSAADNLLLYIIELEGYEGLATQFRLMRSGWWYS